MGKQVLRLQSKSPVAAGQSWESDQLLRIGRLASLEVLLEDVSVSRRHAEVACTEQGWVVRDLGSTNGTFVNGVRVGRADQRLHSADLLQIGNVKLAVTVQEEASAPAAVADSDVQVEAALCNSWSKVMLCATPGAALPRGSQEQMLALLRIGRDFSPNTSPDEFLQSLIRDAVVALRAYRGALLLADSSGKLFPRAVLATPGSRGTGWLDLRFPEQAFGQGESLLCQDVLKGHWVAPPSTPAPPASSILCALLRSPRSRLGVLYLDRGPQQPAFTRDELHLADVLAASVTGTVEGVQYFADRENGLFVQTLTALAQAVELRDDYTGSHTQRVTDYALLLADELKLPPMDRMYLQVGTPLHDIGKIGISDAILLKPGHLTEEEYSYMKSHTWKGAAILEIIPHLAPILPIVRNHHEHWDGSGYPDRLGREDIPQLGRIVAVADAFDAMTSDRPYRPGMPAERAFAEIRKKAGIQFDPECAEAFLRVRPRVEELIRQQRQLMETASRDEVLRAVGSPSILLGLPPLNKRTAAVPRLSPEVVQTLLAGKKDPDPAEE